MSRTATTVDRLSDGDAPKARPPVKKFDWAWIGVTPFFLYAILFLFFPSASIFVRSFRSVGWWFHLRKYHPHLPTAAIS